MFPNFYSKNFICLTVLLNLVLNYENELIQWVKKVILVSFSILKSHLEFVTLYHVIDLYEVNVSNLNPEYANECYIEITITYVPNSISFIL